MKKILLIITTLFLGLTLVGCVEENPEPTMYTVSFTTNAEGVSIPAVQVEENKTVTEPTQPTKEGYGFSGWFSDSTLNVPYDFSKPVSGNLTLYAKWTDTAFTIHFNTNGGSDVEDMNVALGENFTLPTPTKEGETFDGWYLDIDLTTIFSGENPTEDITLFAKWTTNVYTLTIYDLDGNIVATEEVAFNVVLPDVDLSSIGQYAVLDGVYLDSSLTTPNTHVMMPSSDLDLYLDYHVEAPATLHIVFVPSRDPSEILEVTSPLEYLLIDELDTLGVTIDEVEISVSSTYEAAAEMIDDGVADIAFIPSGIYAMYDMVSENFNLLLVATRTSRMPDSTDISDWNNGSTFLADEVDLPYYFSLMIAGPSAAGQGIRSAIEAGYTPDWEAISNLTWCFTSYTSSSSYVYPNAWLMEHYGKTMEDMPNTINTGGYGNTMASLASEVCDIGTFYSDARQQYEEDWISYFGRSNSIWDETFVIGVSHPIMNDVIVTSRATVSDELHATLQTAFLNLAETPEGLDVFSIYSHYGYAIVDTSFFDYMKQYIYS